MTKLLVIAEKPSVALDLAKAMGPFDRHDGGDYFETNDYVISFAVGHLVELEQPEAYDKKWRAWTTKSLPILPDEMRRKPRDGKATLSATNGASPSPSRPSTFPLTLSP